VWYLWRRPLVDSSRDWTWTSTPAPSCREGVAVEDVSPSVDSKVAKRSSIEDDDDDDDTAVPAAVEAVIATLKRRLRVEDS